MTQERLLEREITGDVIGAFYEVYNQLGFGFLEFIYSLALEKELLKRGRAVAREVAVPVVYKGEILANQRVVWLSTTKSWSRSNRLKYYTPKLAA
jgi:GxxExxY protein